MHANPEPIPREKASAPPLVPLRREPWPSTLRSQAVRFLQLWGLSFWRAFQHDAFATAKASAYSSILTFFPTLLVVGSVLAASRKTAAYLREVSYALGSILPAGSATVVDYLKQTNRPVGLMVTTSLLTLWTASGIMISWMDGFRRCYELPKKWGLVKERLISLALVILAGIPMTFATVLVAFGSRIETRVLFLIGHEFDVYIVLMWTAIRWIIATLTSIAVLALIYHNAVPRTQPWHSVLPGATLATGMWFGATTAFGWYVQRYANYSVLYGSLGVTIALLGWMYLISVVVLVGAELNALLYPRLLLGRELSSAETRHLLPSRKVLK